LARVASSDPSTQDLSLLSKPPQVGQRIKPTVQIAIFPTWPAAAKRYR
jgi:hypothetical protein